MPKRLLRTSDRTSRACVALLICSALGIQCHRVSQPGEPAQAHIAVTEQLPEATLAAATSNNFESLANADPLAFLYHCRENYDRNIRDYSCTFVKQELVRGKMTAEQETVVKCRQNPFSVNMRWIRNAADAAHVTYIESRWKDKQGQEQAWCEPAGSIARLFVKKILQPIHGKRAEKASRRTIDQFGFRNTLDLIIHYSEKAADEGVLDLRFVNRGSVDGRPTYVFERRLPYTGQEEPYPDRLLVFHIDQEWLLPTACYSYADDGRETLLGKYLLTGADFNLGLTDSDFGPDTLGL